MNDRLELVILLRASFLDSIPSLKSLIIYLANIGYKITIISSYNRQCGELNICSPNVALEIVKERRYKLGVPTSIRLLVRLARYFFKKHVCYIGGDAIANRLLYVLSRFIGLKYVDFLLEYPNLEDITEMNVLNHARYIITHDKWHSSFLAKEFGIDESKVLLLPNASYTPQCYSRDTYLYNLFNIAQDKNIILHSGGFGKQFMSKELIREAASWFSNNILVFHTSYNVSYGSYYNEIISSQEIPANVKFSINPVSNEILDKLISSATIGLAIYSVDVLGYRALYMGLAAGKIGNYLKCGIPVIATRLPSLTYLEEYGCGILIDKLSQIQDAIAEISKNYGVFSQNAHKCYGELWNPKPYMAIIKQHITE